MQECLCKIGAAPLAAAACMRTLQGVRLKTGVRLYYKLEPWDPAWQPLQHHAMHLPPAAVRSLTPEPHGCMQRAGLRPEAPQRLHLPRLGQNGRQQHRQQATFLWGAFWGTGSCPSSFPACQRPGWSSLASQRACR